MPVVNRRRGALALLALLACAGCASLSKLALGPVEVNAGRRFLIVRSARSDWGFITHPFLSPIASNRLVCFYEIMGDVLAGVVGKSGGEGPAYTDDGGRTWKFGDPMTWVDGPPDVQTSYKVGQSITNHYGFLWNFAQFPDGHRVAYERGFTSIWSNWRTLGQMTNRMVWSDDGVNWHGPQHVMLDRLPTNDIPHEYVNGIVLSPRALLMPDGRLLSIAYNAPYTPPLLYSTILLESTNRGVSWQYLSTVARTNAIIRHDEFGVEGPCEPSLVRLPDGELLCIMRAGVAMVNAFVSKGYCLELVEARSRDDGRTWTTRQLKDLRGVMPILYQMSNGVLALAYGRPGCRVTFSVDGGHTWGNEVELVPYHVRTSGYTDMHEISPGRLLVVFDEYGVPPAQIWLWNPPTPVNSIFGRCIDVKPRQPLPSTGE
jgi:hypothetical protein